MTTTIDYQRFRAPRFWGDERRDTTGSARFPKPSRGRRQPVQYKTRILAEYDAIDLLRPRSTAAPRGALLLADQHLAPAARSGRE